MASTINKCYGQFYFGVSDPGTASSSTIDSIYTAGSSGDAIGIRFICHKTQSNGTVDFHAFATSVTGSPNIFCEIRAGSGTDPERPNTSTQVGVSASQVPVVNTWNTWSLTGISLTEGEIYFILLYSDNADAVTNKCNIQTRGTIDSFTTYANTPTSNQQLFFNMLTTTDGFSTDPTLQTYIGTFVTKFADGSIYGNPYVSSGSHASNANYRGTRINLPMSVSINSLFINSIANSTSATVGVYQASSTVVEKNCNYLSSIRGIITAFTPVTLLANTNYDLLWKPSASVTTASIVTMGEIEANLPADVLACRFGTYVEGSTLGSLTEDITSVYMYGVMIDAFPISGGPLIGKGGLLV